MLPEILVLAAGDSSPGMAWSSFSSEDEANAELAEARHGSAQAIAWIFEVKSPDATFDPFGPDSTDRPRT